MFKKLAKKLYSEREKSSSAATNPLNVDFDNNKREFLNKLTTKAIDLFEKKSDIKKFSKLVLSNPENNSHNEIINDLFSDGVIDPFEDEKLLQLSDNTKFLRDLGLID